MSSGDDPVMSERPSVQQNAGLWVTMGRLWHSNVASEDPEVVFCSELTAKVVIVSTLLFYLDLVTDCLVLHRCLAKDPPDWQLFGVTLATSVLPNVFFCYQVLNYAHIMKSVGSSVLWSCIQALTYTLPAVAVYKKARFGKDPIEWRANLYGSARSFCANLPCHFFQFLKAFDPSTPPELRTSVLVSCIIVYTSSGFAAFRYHLEIGEPTNLQKYRFCGFRQRKKWLLLLCVNSLVSGFVKLVGPALVAVLFGFAYALAIPVAHIAVSLCLHLGNVARIRGMGWHPETGRLSYTKWLNASASAVAQRYLLDLVFMRAPNSLFLARYEGVMVASFAAACVACIFSRYGAEPEPVTRTEPGSLARPRAWPRHMGYEVFVALYVAALVLFIVFRLMVQLLFREEMGQRSQTAETWLKGMDAKRAAAQKTCAEAKAAGYESVAELEAKAAQGQDSYAMETEARAREFNMGMEHKAPAGESAWGSRVRRDSI